MPCTHHPDRTTPTKNPHHDATSPKLARVRFNGRIAELEEEFYALTHGPRGSQVEREAVRTGKLPRLRGGAEFDLVRDRVGAWLADLSRASLVFRTQIAEDLLCGFGESRLDSEAVAVDVDSNPRAP